MNEPKKIIFIKIFWWIISLFSYSNELVRNDPKFLILTFTDQELVLYVSDLIFFVIFDQINLKQIEAQYWATIYIYISLSKISGWYILLQLETEIHNLSYL
jgi:hypothetical protein